MRIDSIDRYMIHVDTRVCCLELNWLLCYFESIYVGGHVDMICLGFMSSLRLLRSRKLLWMSWVEAYGFPTLKFSKASIINTEVIWNAWCSWKVLWKFLKSFPESYPSYLSVRPQVMDLLSLPMEVPMPRIPWMAINHHEVWPSRGAFEWLHLQIISSHF